MKTLTTLMQPIKSGMKRMAYLSLMVVMVAACGCLWSCSTSSHAHKNKVWVDMMSEKKPIQLTEAQRVFVKDNNAFTLNFMKAVSEADHSGKSFIFSPLSITYLLAMVNNAAGGATEQELEQTLGFSEGGMQAVNEYCRNLINNMPKVDEKVELNIANAIFLNMGYQLKEQFKQDMQEYFHANAEVLDFSSKKAVSHINNWCNKETKGLIPSITSSVDPDAISYLLNAIYFKADWTKKFDPQNTKEETFTTEKGRREMPMMHQNVLIDYVKNDTYAAIDIPYGNKLWCMTVMLPEEGKTTDDIIQLLAQTGWGTAQHQSLMKGMTAYKVDLKLPRYETSSDTDNLENGLQGLLENLGIRQVFNPKCMDIVNMCDRPVYVNMIRQKAMIKVNEEGTEAAAVTASGVLGGAAVDLTPRATFHANRPFVYVIRELSSGVILFVGKFTGE